MITRIRDVQKIKLGPDSKLKVGDPFLDYLPEVGPISEIIEVDGQKYALGPLSDLIDEFKYDSQKRVTEHVHILTTAKGAEVYSYEYPSPNQLIQKYVHEGFPTQSGTVTYQLDNEGLIDRTKESFVSGDYFGHYSYGGNPANNPVFKNNPSVSEGTNPITGKYTSIVEFDLSKPNLPNPVPFFGKTDLNLPLNSTLTYETYIPKVVGVEHRYTFDSQGKVIRRITINTYDSDKGVTVTEYEYKCQ
ncbi:hypothetical protein [Larkinella rosea]|uniref:Uncharacterized protein n=1 Tax=Larkinella rosea TaxID=2025312 RepID=A0A3P1B990_9BACT|nr:hypothetical protein [Larkinella rosea]RRA97677.1 hypothetical protein EHT25_32035 [Larkinella rosea]